MHSIEKIEKGFRLAAIPVVLISAFFTYQFAASTMQSAGMGMLLGLACAICAVASGYVWTIRQFAQGFGAGKGTLAVMMLCGLMFTGTDAFTNAGSLLWQRAASDNADMVQNIKFDESQKQIADTEKQIAFFEARIKDLKDANPWITSVSADGLKGQIPAIDEAILQESNRGGCGPKCLILKEKKAALLDQVGKAEKLESHSKMLAAAHRGLEKARAKADTKTSVVSATSSQAQSIATLISLDLNPSDESQAWTSYVVGLILAVFLTFGGMGLNWIGFGAWRQSSFVGLGATAKADLEHHVSDAVRTLKTARANTAGALNSNDLFEDMLARLDVAKAA